MRSHVVALISGVSRDKTEHRTKFDVDVAVLEHLIVKVLLREVSLKGKQRAVFLRRIGERVFIGDVLRTIFRDLALRRLIVSFRLLLHSEKILDV